MSLTRWLAWLLTGSASAGFANITPTLQLDLRYLADDAFGGVTEATAAPALDWSASNAFVRIGARLRWHDSPVLEGTPPNQDEFGHELRYHLGSHGVTELREAYVRWWRGPIELTLGKQFVNWGSLDGFRVLDAVSPRDLREFVLADDADARIATIAARAEMSGSGWRWQVVYSPDRTVHDLPDPGTAFVPIGPRYRAGGVPVLELPGLTREVPRRDTWATQISGAAGSLSWRAVAVDGFGYEPVLALGPANEPRLSYPPRRLYGLGFDAGVGPLVLRGEIAHRRGAFNTSDGSHRVVRGNQLQAGVGVDLTAPYDVFVTAQWFTDQVLNAPNALQRPASDHIATLAVRRRWQDRWQLEGRWYEDLAHSGRLWRAILAYDFASGTRIAMSVDRFDGAHGGSDSVLGQFDGRDRIAFSLSHTL